MTWITSLILCLIFQTTILIAVSENDLTEDEKKVIFCAVNAWAGYRQSEGRFTPSEIDPTLCTHIIYSLVGIDENTSKVVHIDKYLDVKERGRGLGQIAQLTNLRDSSHSNVKILISIGGWDEGSIKFSNLAASTAKIDTFVTSVIDFLKKHKLDGVDINWISPTDRGGIPEDKDNFPVLLKELKKRLEREDKILTVFLSAKRYIIDPGYDIRAISEYVDYMHIMTFEYFGPWDLRTGVNAPLSSPGELNVKFSIEYFIKNGAAPSKITLGIPVYGHCMTMESVPEDGKYLNIPSDKGYKNPWTNWDGLIGYNEVCYQLNSTSGWEEFWDDESSTPYAVNNRKFISFDNQRSIELKVFQRPRTLFKTLALLKRLCSEYDIELQMAASKGLGGVHVRDLDTDDFKGICGGGKFPLVNSIKQFFKKGKTIKITNVGVISHPYG